MLFASHSFQGNSTLCTFLANKNCTIDITGFSVTAFPNLKKKARKAESGQ